MFVLLYFFARIETCLRGKQEKFGAMMGGEARDTIFTATRWHDEQSFMHTDLRRSGEIKTDDGF